MKKSKIIKLVDPEPQDCYVMKGCGYDEVIDVRTGIIVLDVIRTTRFIPARRDDPGYFMDHMPECAWRAWALRELARRDQS